MIIEALLCGVVILIALFVIVLLSIGFGFCVNEFVVGEEIIEFFNRILRLRCDSFVGYGISGFLLILSFIILSFMIGSPIYMLGKLI